jgi:dsRNA-specific ribonuclease
MDPLSTFGDAVLDAVAVYRLYNAGVRTQGELTIFKSNQVKREKTHAFAQKNHLEKYIRWGDGEFKQKIWEQGQEAFDAVTEAIIGAIFLDAQKSEKNGFEIVEKFLGETDFFEKDSR